MAKLVGKTKKKRGRPTTGAGVQIGMRWQASTLRQVDAWASQQEDTPSRAEAIRRLVEFGLESAEPPKKTSLKSAAKAAGLAGDMVDFLGDQSATSEDRAKRKRRLLKGPSEFREMRTDLGKKS